VLNQKLRFYDAGARVIAPEVGENLKRAVGELVQLAAEDAGSQSASFYITDWRERVLKPFVTYQLPDDYVAACGFVRVGDQCCGRAVQMRKPWIVSDMLSDPLFASARKAAEVSPIRAGFSVPVTNGNNECIGSLACHYSEPYTPRPEQIEKNELWASMISHAISEYRAATRSEDAIAAAPEGVNGEFRDLCRRIAIERDPVTFQSLVEKLDAALNVKPPSGF